MHLPLVMDAPEITSVCFKQIDGDYWFAWYLDLVIVMNKQTGWVNATKFCDRICKTILTLEKQQTKDLISVF